MKLLYIFVTSERPDQYLNPILHCLLYENINHVVFIHIKGLDRVTGASESNNNDKGISSSVLGNVQVLLDSLASHVEYRYFIGHKAGERIRLTDFYSTEEINRIRNFYMQFRDKNISWSNKDINYLELRKELANIYTQQDENIFDITAMDKSLIGDILAVGIIEGIKRIYTFDLQVRPNFDEPWRMLFHELQSDRSTKVCYRYVNIVDTSVFRECANSILVRKVPLKISLIAAPILIILVLLINFVFGSTNWAVQSIVILSAIASLLSLYYNFFPPRK